MRDRELSDGLAGQGSRAAGVRLELASQLQGFHLASIVVVVVDPCLVWDRHTYEMTCPTLEVQA